MTDTPNLDRVRGETLNRIERGERNVKLAVLGAAVVEALLLGSFLLAADFLEPYSSAAADLDRGDLHHPGPGADRPGRARQPQHPHPAQGHRDGGEEVDGTLITYRPL